MPTQFQKQLQAATEITVSPDDCQITTDSNCRLIARGIESCVTLAVHAPKLGIAALLRFSNPKSEPSDSLETAGSSADTAVPLLFGHLRKAGIQTSELMVYAVGASVNGNDEASAALAKKNELALRRLLWREGVILTGEDLGGTEPRSLWFDTGSGRVIVRTGSYTSAAAPAQRPQGDKQCRFAS